MNLLSHAVAFLLVGLFFLIIDGLFMQRWPDKHSRFFLNMSLLCALVALTITALELLLGGK